MNCCNITQCDFGQKYNSKEIMCSLQEEGNNSGWEVEDDCWKKNASSLPKIHFLLDGNLFKIL